MGQNALFGTQSAYQQHSSLGLQAASFMASPRGLVQGLQGGLRVLYFPTTSDFTPDET